MIDFDVLLYIMFALFYGIYIGRRHERKKLTDFIENIEPEQDPKFSRYEKLTIETHDQQYFAYGERDLYLAHHSSVEGLVDILCDRYKNTHFTIVSADDSIMQQLQDLAKKNKEANT